MLFNCATIDHCKRIEFVVLGRPQTAGSKRAFPGQRQDGSLYVNVTDDNPKGKAWRTLVQDRAREAHAGDLLLGPIRLEVTFYFSRPRSHFRTGKFARALKDSAPRFHTVKPDATKLLRCLEDALKGITWNDDSQVAEQFATKLYAAAGEAERAVVVITSLGKEAW